MNHRKRLSDLAESVVPTLNLSQLNSEDSSFDIKNLEPQRRQYFTTYGQLDEKIANIESLISSLQSNLQDTEKKRGHRRTHSNFRKKDLILDRAMLGYILPIKNIKK